MGTDRPQTNIKKESVGRRRVDGGRVGLFLKLKECKRREGTHITVLMTTDRSSISIFKNTVLMHSGSALRRKLDGPNHRLCLVSAGPHFRFISSLASGPQKQFVLSLPVSNKTFPGRSANQSFIPLLPTHPLSLVWTCAE